MSAWVDDGQYALPQALVDIVNQLTGPGEYLREELPVEAFWSYHTDYYLAQVNNGGHGQFARNSGWTDAVNADIRNGLRAMTLSSTEEIFSEFERFARNEPTRFTVAREDGGFGDIDPVIADLDARFFSNRQQGHSPCPYRVAAHAAGAGAGVRCRTASTSERTDHRQSAARGARMPNASG